MLAVHRKATKFHQSTKMWFVTWSFVATLNTSELCDTYRKLWTRHSVTALPPFKADFTWYRMRCRDQLNRTVHHTSYFAWPLQITLAVSESLWIKARLVWCSMSLLLTVLKGLRRDLLSETKSRVRLATNYFFSQNAYLSTNTIKM